MHKTTVNLSKQIINKRRCYSFWWYTLERRADTVIVSLP